MHQASVGDDPLFVGVPHEEISVFELPLLCADTAPDMVGSFFDGF